MIRSFQANSRQAFSLVEVVLGVSLFSLVIGSMGLLSSRNYAAVHAARARAQCESNLRQTFERLTRELIAADADLVLPANTGQFGSDTIDFQTIVAVAAGVPVPGPVTRISLELEAGELDDGLDNNGNGLVDEGILVLTRDVGGAGEQRTILCHGVAEYFEGESGDGNDENGNGLIDEAGFHFELDGTVITLRMTLVGQDREGLLFFRSLQTRVRARN